MKGPYFAWRSFCEISRRSVIVSAWSSIIYSHKFNKEAQQNKTTQLYNLRVIQASSNYSIKLSCLKTVLQIDFENTIGGKDVSNI